MYTRRLKIGTAFEMGEATDRPTDLSTGIHGRTKVDHTVTNVFLREVLATGICYFFILLRYSAPRVLHALYVHIICRCIRSFFFHVELKLAPVG